MNKKEHQGKYHLLAIFVIPALLVSFFLSESWLPPLLVLGLAILLIFILFKSKR